MILVSHSYPVLDTRIYRTLPYIVSHPSDIISHDNCYSYWCIVVVKEIGAQPNVPLRSYAFLLRCYAFLAKYGDQWYVMVP